MKLTKRNIGDWVTQKEWLGTYKVAFVGKLHIILSNGLDFTVRPITDDFIVIKKKEKKK